MFKFQNYIIFLFIILLNLSKSDAVECIMEWQPCVSESFYTTLNCCPPLQCIFKDRDTSQCEFLDNGVNCLHRDNNCDIEGYNCCEGLFCFEYGEGDKRCGLPFDKEPVVVRNCVAQNEQCSGISDILGSIWDGLSNCCAGLTCKGTSVYYSQCLP